MKINKYLMRKAREDIDEFRANVAFVRMNMKITYSPREDSGIYVEDLYRRESFLGLLVSPIPKIHMLFARFILDGNYTEDGVSRLFEFT